jgi:hypothetical protein
VSKVGEDHIEVRADLFNAFNNQNLLSGGHINLIGNARSRRHSGGSNVLPGRQFQFAGTYRFSVAAERGSPSVLSGGRNRDSPHFRLAETAPLTRSLCSHETRTK